MRGRLYKDCRGAITVEMAVISTAVLALLPLMMDLASVISSSMSLSGALRAGIQLALSQPNNSSGITQTVKTASGFPASQVAVSSSQDCECAGISATCGAYCSDGSWPAMYMTITASYPVPTIFPFDGYPSSTFSLTRSTTVRLQ